MSKTSALAKRLNSLRSQRTIPGILAGSMFEILGFSKYREVPLSQAYPGVDIFSANYEHEYQAPLVLESKLSNGVRVVSRNSPFDALTNLGVYIQVGSRHLPAHLSGLPHFMETLAIEGTLNINAQRFAENCARNGCVLSVNAYRDALTYQFECMRGNADFALESIAELMFNPRNEPWLFENMFKDYLWRRGDMMRDSQIEVPEMMHLAAYQGNTLGLPLYFDAQNIHNVNCQVISDFIGNYYLPQRMIVVGNGYDHTELEKLAQNCFGDLAANSQPLHTEKARYSGGDMKLKHTFEDDKSTHVALLFETESWTSPDLLSLCVLSMIMGGGGSFSAGGPGKGMHARLYRNALGKYPFINHISTSHSIFTDSGLFCIYGNCDGEHAGDLTSVMVKESLGMLHNEMQSDELQRGKRSLYANICYEYENRGVVFEDIARQMDVYAKYTTPRMFKEQIDAITKEDVQRVVHKLLNTKPTLLAVGPDILQVPMVSEVSEIIQKSIK